MIKSRIPSTYFGQMWPWKRVVSGILWYFNASCKVPGVLGLQVFLDISLPCAKYLNYFSILYTSTQYINTLFIIKYVFGTLMHLVQSIWSTWYFYTQTTLTLQTPKFFWCKEDVNKLLILVPLIRLLTVYLCMVSFHLAANHKAQ